MEGQKKCARISHPLLDGAVDITPQEFETYKIAFLNHDCATAREALIMGHMSRVSIIVGRFLANWPETLRFEEDMVSEGFVATTIEVDELELATTHEKFKGSLWPKIQNRIETLLNDSRSIFSASKTTNYRRIQEGEEPVYNYAQQIRPQLDAGMYDSSEEWIDMLDDLESLAQEDKESFRSLIIRCMENDHDISEDDLTEAEINAINRLSKLLGEI